MTLFTPGRTCQWRAPGCKSPNDKKRVPVVCALHPEACRVLQVSDAAFGPPGRMQKILFMVRSPSVWISFSCRLLSFRQAKALRVHILFRARCDKETILVSRQREEGYSRKRKVCPGIAPSAATVKGADHGSDEDCRKGTG